MSCFRLAYRFGRNSCGASAAEFALILPVFLLFLLGLIDVGRYAWAINEAEKATQTGARWAVATDVLSPGLASANYVGVTVGGVTLTQGDRIPAAALGLMRCTSSACTCVTNPCPTPGTMPAARFAALAARMRDIKGDIAPANVVVEYSGSGLGYAGDPNGIEISPFVTVRLQNMTFPLLFMLGRRVGLPSFRYSLPMEDGLGTTSN